MSGAGHEVLRQGSGATQPVARCRAVVTCPQLVPLAAGGRGRWRPDTLMSSMQAGEERRGDDDYKTGGWEIRRALEDTERVLRGGRMSKRKEEGK